MSGPRIYNLFPPLAGTVRQWEEHLPRIAGMRFNWVFLNPFHEPGWSGSLYAVKDYYRLNPLFQGQSRQPPDDLLREFIHRAAGHGRSVIMDLVINHTSKDSPLVGEHPDWYQHNEDGSVRSPGAEDPTAPEGRVVWGDLAEINFEGPGHAGLLEYWKQVVRYYTRLGFAGFRCDAAYQVPGAAWKEIIAAGKEANPQVHFLAETLGAKPDQITQLGSAGFDFFFNSSKWWDFREGWLLEQYEQFRHIAPSIAFPESHDTRRLTDESGGNEALSRLRYLFAAFFSSGVMMPIGYEFGFRRKLHVVETRPDHWEQPTFDLSPFIATTNEMKERAPVLNEEGPQERITPPDDPVVGLLRRSERSPERAAALLNPDPQQAREFPIAGLEQAFATDRQHIRDITPLVSAPTVEGDVIRLPPCSLRVFHCHGT
jgi:starch synthase (maltosyl-transferring)